MASRTARFVEFVSLPVYPSDTSTSPFAVAGAVLVLSPDAALPVVGLVCKDQVALCVKRLDAIKALKFLGTEEQKPALHVLECRLLMML